MRVFGFELATLSMAMAAMRLVYALQFPRPVVTVQPRLGSARLGALRPAKCSLAEGNADVQVEETWDVSRNCVNPVFRSPVHQDTAPGSARVQIIFASEGNVCRSVIAEAIFNRLLRESGLESLVECSSKATLNYNIGEPPDPKVVELAAKHGLQLPQGAVAKAFDYARDIVQADLIVVMDKFNASDVMKQVVLLEVVDKRNSYSYKVRRIGDFCKSREVEDIDDPLYGNMGGPEELVLLEQAYIDITESCEGLLEHLLEMRASLSADADCQMLREVLERTASGWSSVEWVAPPMLER